ncbi:hypothetical protein [Streptomyces sp. SYP-A7185]|uniref:hypothetical protein n=1 Tax=Streptomyces sp. SYP-A7185 TaxID=3040076 RepID=UPI0038F79544
MTVTPEPASSKGPVALTGQTTTLKKGVVTVGGAPRDRTLVPLPARLVRAAEGAVDILVDLPGPNAAPSARQNTHTASGRGAS